MIPKLLLGVLLFSGLTGCGGPLTSVRYDRQTRFEELRTFAWATDASPLSPELAVDKSLDGRIRSAIVAELQNKGLSAVERSKADLLLTYEAAAQEKVDADLRNYAAAEMMDMTYLLGTLRLSMARPVEAGTAAVVWQSSAQARIEPSKPLPQREEQLREAIAAMLKKFPPK